MVKLVAILAVFCTLLPGTASAAALLVSPVPSTDAAVSIDFAVNQVHYEVPWDRFRISRGIVSLSWLYESFFASVGSIVNTDFDHDLAADRVFSSGESGFLLAAGARGALWRAGDFAINGHVQIHGLNEDVASGGARHSLKSQEILAGVVAAWEPPGWRVYGGIEALPYSHIETGLPGYEEIKRAEFISLHFGGEVDLGPVFLNAGLQLVGTEGLRIGVGYAF